MPETKIIISKETKVFYSILSMMACAKQMKEYLLSNGVKAVHYSIKQDLNNLFRHYDRFVSDCTASVPPESAKIWRAEWIDRDYQSFGAVFQMMSVMTDEQREQVEKLCTQLTAENI